MGNESTTEDSDDGVHSDGPAPSDTTKRLMTVQDDDLVKEMDKELDESIELDTVLSGHHELDAVTDIRERRRVLRRLYDALKEDGFSYDSIYFKPVVRELLRYGAGFTAGRVRSRLIWGDIADIRRGITPTPSALKLLQRDPEALTRLIKEVADAALDLWLDAEIAGRGWNPDGGADLLTYFSNACIRQFPNGFRRWYQEYDWYEVEFLEAELGSNFDIAELDLTEGSEYRRPAVFPPPEATAVLKDEVEDAFRSLLTGDGVLSGKQEREIVHLKAAGFPYDYIAEAVGLQKAEDITNFYKRLERRILRSQTEGN